MKNRFLTTPFVACILISLLGIGGNKKNASLRDAIDRFQDVGVMHEGVFVANPTFDGRTRIDRLREDISFQDFFRGRGEENCPDCVDFPEGGDPPTPDPQPSPEPSPEPTATPKPTNGGHMSNTISHLDIEEPVTEVIEPVYERMVLSTHTSTEEDSDEDE